VTRPVVTLLVAGLLLITAPRAWIPLPPPLPTNPPTDRAAPMPNDNVPAPSVPGNNDDRFALRIYPMNNYNTGDGFIPGSAYEPPEERKPLQPPGFMVTVPLR
jgi:hypothetical protein